VPCFFKALGIGYAICIIPNTIACVLVRTVAGEDVNTPGSSADVALGIVTFLAGTMTITVIIKLLIYFRHKVDEYNNTIFRDQMENWHRSYMCERCANVFYA
jgi:hypothetical protein